VIGASRAINPMTSVRPFPAIPSYGLAAVKTHRSLINTPFEVWKVDGKIRIETINGT
jgi:hypothetical protein